ncbi:MAG TPA: FtsX-like permease family protein [Candidatus Saccharimonadales bacterium]|jgi:putative ABC transport system permease protein|nr:FtsX-like permease family protein [Candidatus Saccharimonadales bacterium]
MNVITRGFRNVFRNSIRAVSIVVILGLSIGLALTMLIARQAVNQKIQSVKSSIGNTISIAPAGFSSFSSVNNSLTTSELNKVSALPHVKGVTETLTDRLTTIGSTQSSFGGFGGQSSSTSAGQTSLTSPITFNIGSGGGGHFFYSGGAGGSTTAPTNFTPPITIAGTNNPTSLDGTSLTISSGKIINGSSTADDALISAAMASKNNLKVGSTFTAYGATLTVTGIFKTSNQSDENNVIVSLPTEQSLSGQTGDITSAVVTVDSLDNLDSVTTAIKNTLGTSADVTSAEAQATATVQPLNSVKNVSLFSLVGAVIAGAVIILLNMIMIVRERRREVGVLKAIGASNIRIMVQFVTEAVTFTLMGAVIGLIIGVVGGNPVTKLLVNNSSSTASTSTTAGPGAGFSANGGSPSTTVTRGAGGGGFFNRVGGRSTVSSIKNIHAVIGWSILLDGLAAAVVIALIGSAIASVLISRIRPAEVMRTE